MKRKDIQLASFTGAHPKLSVAVYATAGEVMCDFSTGVPSQGRVAKSSSPVYNIQNKAVALVQTFNDLADHNIIAVAVVNTSTSDATGRIEVVSKAAPNGGSKAELDEAFTVASGATFTYHIAISVTF